MTAPARFIILVIGIVVGAAVLMAPRGNEQLAMLQDEDKHAQIIALLEPRIARGENDPNLLATLGRAYAEIGSYQHAIELMERYISLRPDDAEAYARLADLYGKVDDVTRQIAMLERSVAIAPTLARATNLAALYQQENQADKELALLSRFESQLTVGNGLLLRLAELRAATGDRDGAISILMRSEGLPAPTPLTQTGDARIFLAKLLVESGRSAEAVRLGKEWILQWHEPWLADRLLRGIMLEAPVADASELADAVAVLHPEIRFFLVRGLATMGAKPVARHLLSTWVKENPSPSTNDIAGFLSACREQGEPEIVWQAFGEVLSRPASNDLIARYSEAIAAEFGIGALAPFWGSLPQEVTERRPLLAAQLAFHEHNLAMTKWLLGKVDLATLGTSYRQTWIDLLMAVTAPPDAFGVLRDLRRSGHLPADLLPQYARLAGELGQDIEYRAALVDLGRNVH
jgi:tetratricopeptide (TPR) repeat protein